MTVAITNAQCALRRLARSAKPLTTADLLTDPSDGSGGRIKYLTLHNAQSAVRSLESKGLAKRQGRLWEITEKGKEVWLKLARELDLTP